MDCSSPDRLTVKQARILEAYYALRQRLPGSSIGSREIRQELRVKAPDVRPPSEALVRDVLLSHGLPRRVEGRPRLTSKEVAATEDPLDAAASAQSVSPTRPRSDKRSAVSCFLR